MKGQRVLYQTNWWFLTAFFLFRLPNSMQSASNPVFNTLSYLPPTCYLNCIFSRTELQMLLREISLQIQYLVKWYSLKFGIGVNEWSRFLMIWCIGKITSIEQWTSWVEKMAASLQVHRILDLIWYSRDKVCPRWPPVDRQDFYVCIHSLLSRLPMGHKYWSEFDACR